MSIAKNIVETVGNTPLIKLNRVTEGLDCEIFLKAEFANPLFSVKDRIGKAMIEDAEKSGKLKPGGTIVEATSGNTGIALAFVSRAKGYKCILTMPETMSVERRILLRSLGAEIVLTPGPRGMGGAIAKAKQILAEDETAFGPGQFDNPANPQVHRETTAEEIWRDTDGKIDALVAGVGTGGTITGIGEVIKSRNPNFKVIAVEPEDSPVISGGSPGPHKIQGIGAGFIPKNLNTDIIDEVVTISNDEAFEMARKLAQMEGIPAGISAGGNVAAALKIAARDDFRGKRIVTIGCSATERYLSTPLAERYREEVTQLPVAELPE